MSSYTELIDTLWNVNTVCLDELTEEQIELIDTLWNVNLNYLNPSLHCLRINRYIMECKYDWNIVTRYGTYELIDTLWNVNLLT